MPSSHIVELSIRIAQNTTKVHDFLVSRNLPGPSFDENAPQTLLPPDTDPDIVLAHRAVIDDCRELRMLMLGPREHVMSYQANDLVSQKAITQFRLAHAVPIGGETTFADLAANTGLGPTHIRKLLRHAIAHKIFREPRPGVVAHSAASRALAEDAELHNWVEYATHELWLAAYHTPDAMQKFPGSGEPNETGFAVANNTDKSLFAFFSDHPDRLARFAAVMRFVTKRPELGPELVVDAFPWASLPEGGTVVDVGGSHGLVCFELARRFPQLHFVVQDLDEPVVRHAETQKPAEIAGRVSFMVHDFFEPQPVRDADVYFLRAVLHNWSDTYAVKILRALIPALKPGSRIVVNDVVVPEPGSMSDAQDLRTRTSDMTQVILQNAGDRELADWMALFKAADERFLFRGASPMQGSTRLWVLVVEWDGA
ncbi:S-adenosyl-L-methionine-dependent methyltransferase [Echria macrotheca]|uniref:S-adenosyl-L-methionine-dependent methyltransferase n=1 Tax=Echria macrotheca TaxID=438768 RepID=A0AAJ0FB54_9PEZI|nr:S-adenosyl-L-methionine-dependent methyltransferase [Echria macrotheca]